MCCWLVFIALQEYIYSFKYGDSGVEFEVNTSSHKGKKKDKYNSADAKVCLDWVQESCPCCPCCTCCLLCKLLLEPGILRICL